ncbi:hypothetical protein [Sphingobium yanoikuyae]|uniref:hypothetical protein n=1 Tax=Sphingobium yanoikuyae TaxID=13690 RepID=UPI00345E1DEB
MSGAGLEAENGIVELQLTGSCGVEGLYIDLHGLALLAFGRFGSAASAGVSAGAALLFAACFRLAG